MISSTGYVEKTPDYLADGGPNCEPVPPGCCIVVKSDASTLLLDLDTFSSVAQFVDRLPTFEQFYQVDWIRIWPSRSSNTHVQIKLKKPIKDGMKSGWMERLLLQQFLGSDPTREFLALQCGLDGRFVSVLFKPYAAPPTTQAAE